MAEASPASGMPWKNELPMEQKQRFINLAQSGRFTVSELSEEFGITRKTGHKWLLRHAGGGTWEALRSVDGDGFA
jgi:transposase-like protein